MGRKLKEYVETDETLYVCHKCNTHLVGEENLMSKEFVASVGQGYLFANV